MKYLKYLLVVVAIKYCIAGQGRRRHVAATIAAGS